MIELAKARSHFRLIRKSFFYSPTSQSIENAEFAFAQPFILMNWRAFVKTTFFLNECNRLLRTYVR